MLRKSKSKGGLWWEDRKKRWVVCLARLLCAALRPRRVRGDGANDFRPLSSHPHSTKLFPLEALDLSVRLKVNDQVCSPVRSPREPLAPLRRSSTSSQRMTTTLSQVPPPPSYLSLGKLARGVWTPKITTRSLMRPCQTKGGERFAAVWADDGRTGSLGVRTKHFTLAGCRGRGKKERSYNRRAPLHAKIDHPTSVHRPSP